MTEAARRASEPAPPPLRRGVRHTRRGELEGEASDGMSPAVIDALRAPDGIAFCRYLRAAAAEEWRHGRVGAMPASGERPHLQRAQDLGLVRATAKGDLRLTPVGYEVANVAKEHANWVEAGRQLPEGITPDLLAGKRVLDVGCSYGRHLLNFTRHDARVWGLEFQHTYLRLSRVFAEQEGIGAVRVCRGRAEHLPFRAGSFDLVFCRLVLNHVSDINGTVGEFARVLVRGGQLVLIVDPLPVAMRRVLASKWLGNSRSVGFALFGLINTAVLELGGPQLQIRWKGRMHSQHSPAWPSSRWLSRRLAAHGFKPWAGRQQLQDERAGLFRGVLAPA